MATAPLFLSKIAEGWFNDFRAPSTAVTTDYESVDAESRRIYKKDLETVNETSLHAFRVYVTKTAHHPGHWHIYLLIDVSQGDYFRWRIRMKEDLTEIRKHVRACCTPYIDSYSLDNFNIYWEVNVV